MMIECLDFNPIRPCKNIMSGELDHMTYREILASRAAIISLAINKKTNNKNG